MAEARQTQLLGVRLSSPDKIMYPEQGATKRQVAEYYASNAGNLLRYAAGRPVSLVRCPRGRDGNCFFQKHPASGVPAELDAIEIEEKDGQRKPYLVINDARGLIAAAQIGALELHVWGARADRIERPERVVFDLDPGPDVGFDAVRRAALELRDVLDAAGLKAFALLTGGKGIHVIVPVQRRRGWGDIKQFARGLARRLAQDSPERYVAVASKAEREGRIYIDWLRNERGATAIAPWSPRARRGAPLATPVGWAELSLIDRADKFSLDNIAMRLERLDAGQTADPWAEYTSVRQSITRSHLDALAR